MKSLLAITLPLLAVGFFGFQVAFSAVVESSHRSGVAIDSTTVGDAKPASGEDEKKSDRDSKDQDAEEESKTEVDESLLAIRGGDIFTVTQGTIRDGVILIRDGKIERIGQRIEIPEDAQVIDASGMKITPGLIALSMSRVGLGSTGSSEYADALDPFDRNVEYSLAVGITTGCVQVTSGGRGRRFSELAPEDFPRDERFVGLDPDLEQAMGSKLRFLRDIGEYESVCECCGLPILPTEPIVPPQPTPIRPQKNVALKMSFGSLDGMLVAQDVFVDLTPGALYSAENQKEWRDLLAKARKYLADKEAHEKAVAKGSKDRPPRKTVADEILKLVRNEASLRIRAEEESEIRGLVELAQELEYGLVIEGASESWLLPDLLAKSNTSVVITPRRIRQPSFGKENESGSWIETPQLLEETGVQFGIATLSNSMSLNGLAGRDLSSLPLEAAFAVRGGASEAEVLAALTIHPATMMGLEDRIGSLEEGKDADLLILNGSPLDFRTYVQTAIVNGRVAYERNEAKVLPVYDR